MSPLYSIFRLFSRASVDRSEAELHRVGGLVVALALVVLGLVPRAQAQTLTDVYPASGVPGTTVRIYGGGFDTDGTDVVTIGGQTATISNVLFGGTAIDVTVPSGTGGSTVDVSVDFGGTTKSLNNAFDVLMGGTGDFPLRRSVDEANVNGVISTATGDINGDGHQDLVVGSLESRTVRWYAGDGAGGFDGGTEVASGLDYPRDVALADLDQDGTLDVLVMEGQARGQSSDGDNTVRSYLNTNGDGLSFSAQDVATSSEDLDNPEAMATGDFNGDGAPDVVVVSDGNDSVYAYRNDDAASGGYTQITIKGSGADDPHAVDVADVDGNGTQDVIVGSISDDTVSWYSNDGTATFGTEQVIATGAIKPRDVDVVDLDGDARLEVLVAQRGDDGTADDGAVAWYDSTSGSWTQNTIATTDSVLTTAAGDVDADGDLDVVAGSVNGDKLVWYENTGGSFSTGTVIRSGRDEVQDVALADLDGDATLDVATVSPAEDALAFYPNVPNPSIIYVDKDATGPTYGTSWTKAKTSLQDALALAEGGDEIWVADGTYKPTTGTDRGISFTVPGGKDGLKIYGGFVGGESSLSERDVAANASVVLSGDIGATSDASDNSYHVLFFDGTTGGNITTATRLDGVTVTGGNADGNGDALSDSGGGLYCYGQSSGNACSPTIANVTFQNNSASTGGGGALYNDGASGTSSPVVKDAVFDSNSATGNGGAIFNQGTSGTSSPQITSTRFIDNTSGANGGAMYNNGDSGESSPYLANVIFAGNATISSGDGGALYNNDGSTGESNPTIANAVFANNTAASDGGAIYNSGDADTSNPLLVNVTLTRNAANGTIGGGALYNTGSSPTITNSILWNNTASSGAEIYNANTGDSPTLANTIIEGGVNGPGIEGGGTNTDDGGNLDQDPQFSGGASLAGPDGSLATSDDSLALLNTSPAIDAGDNTALPTDEADLDEDGSTTDQLSVDLAGANRIQDDGGGATVNLGAYETVQTLRVTSTTPSRNQTGADTALADISITFDRTVDASTVAQESLSVVGDQTGFIPEADGTVGVSGQTLTYQLPSGIDLYPGETVSVSVVGGVTSTDGVSLGTGETVHFTAQSAAGPGTFPKAVAELKGLEDGATDWGDFDEDGDLDLLAVGDGGDFTPTATIYENTSSGLDSLNTGLTGVYYADAAWGDYDNDGDLDVVIAGDDGSSPIAKIYENDVENGNGFSAIGAGLTGVEQGAVDWGDFDGDGDLDLLLVGDNSSGTPIAKIYENDVENGNGFSAIGAGLIGVREASAEWGDYDADGDLDLAITGIDSGEGPSTTIYENQGGSFSALGGSSIPDLQDGSVAWGDYDTDGDLDLVLSGALGGDGTNLSTTIFKKIDSGGFSAEYSLMGVRYSDIEWADYDDDKDPDLIVMGEAGGASTKIYENDVENGNGFSAIGAGLTDVSGGGIDWGDVDGDGDGDLIVAGRNGSGPSIALHKQAAPLKATGSTPTPNTTNVDTSIGEIALTFSRELDDNTLDTRGVALSGSQSGPLPVSSVGVSSGNRLTLTPGQSFEPGEDVTASVLVDSVAATDGVLLGIAASTRFTTRSKAGMGTFPNVAASLTGVTDAEVDVGDVNGDGILDLLVVGSASGSPSTILYLGNGDGTYSTANQGLIDLQDGTADFVDLDADGDLDVFLTGWDGASRRTVAYTNGLSGGTFGFSQSSLSVPGVRSSSVDFSDVDGDGDPDLFLIGEDGTESVTAGLGQNMMKESGSLSFDPTGLKQPFEPSEGVVDGSVDFADVDGDNDPDLLVTGSKMGTPIAELYKNDGAGNFTIASGSNLSAGFIQSTAAFGDIDGNGTADLVLSGRSQGIPTTKVFTNDGSGTFAEMGQGLRGIENGATELSDVDGDGDLDLLLSGADDLESQSTILYMNEGAGSFTAQNAGLPALSQSAAAFADQDGDGDLDLFLAGSEGGTPIAKSYLQSGSLLNAILAGSPDTVRVGTGVVGQASSTATVRLENQGDVSLTSLSARVSGSDSTDFQLAGSEGFDGSTADTLVSVLAPGEADSLDVAFRPSETGRLAARLLVTSEEGGQDTTALVGRGVQVNLEAGTAKRGEPVPMALEVAGGFVSTEAILQVREGGAPSYRSVALEQISTNPLRLEGTVPAEVVTRRGVDYYAELIGQRSDTLRVPAGRSGHLPVEFEDLRAPIGLAPRAYRMVTVPAQVAGGTKAALKRAYGGYDRSVWRVLRWAPSAEQYVEYPKVDSLPVGAAFWLVTQDGEPPVFGSGRTAKAGQATEIPLRAGWNQVGSPFGYAVPWSAVKAASGLEGAKIDGPVGYRDSTGYRRGRSVLRPWRGYFVFSAERDTLVVPPVGAGSQSKPKRAVPEALAGSPLAGGTAANGDRALEQERASSDKEASAQAAGPRTESSSSSRRDQAEGAVPLSGKGQMTAGAEPVLKRKRTQGRYTLRLTARVQGGAPVSESRVWVGYRDEAKTGRDRLDFAQVPPIGRSVRLSVLEKVAGREVAHAGSFKPPVGKGAKAGRTWTLRLDNEAAGQREVRLRMKGAGRLPSGQERYVLDLSRERRLAAGQRIGLKAGEERRLKVIVGTEAYAKNKSEGIELETFKNELRGNYPNPFGEETTLAYTLGEEMTVTVEIYNVLGQRVRTLVREKKQGPGLHRLRWEGENRYGEPVGSGVYFYRIRAGDFRETRKMVLVR